jgi:hypothetical protein
MFKSTIAQLSDQINGFLENAVWKPGQDLDFSEIEIELRDLLKKIGETLLQLILADVIESRDFLSILKICGGWKSYRFKEYRQITITLYDGQKIEVKSPFFLKTTAKRGRKKRGPKNRGCHLGLELLGIYEKMSPLFASRICRQALLCPSFEVACNILAEDGIKIGAKTIRKICIKVGQVGISDRTGMVVCETENVADQRVMICIDGGRLREREKKCGAKKKGAKRNGYKTEWREPKLFTIHLINDEGRPIKTFDPIYDATMKDHEATFDLIEQYLKALNIHAAKQIVFCGDGGPWIWSDSKKLCKRLCIDQSKVVHVLDYTHAKQNLNEIIGYIPKKAGNKKKLEKQMKDSLWQGEIDRIKQLIDENLKTRQKKKACKKWLDYFDKNRTRMQYQDFKKKKLPCGSGCVESAIRRVINLRLKSAGSFWLKQVAEYMLFLRSVLLSGRWKIFMTKFSRRESYEFSKFDNRLMAGIS